VGKKVKGRKRHLLVDTLGFVLNVVVSEANINDRLLMPWLLRSAQAALPRLQLVWADGGYRNDALTLALYQQTGIRVEIVKRPVVASVFRLQPKRWIVERTFAWLGNARRLSKDYELYFKSSASMIYAAMLRLMLRRLARFSTP
jgi:putative transposase